MRANYKIPRWVAVNVSNELYHYWDNKLLLKQIKQDIIDSSPDPADGTPKSNMVGDPTFSKAMKLQSRRILIIEQKLDLIDKALKLLSEDERQLAEIIYKKRMNATTANTYEYITEDTYYNGRRKILWVVANELGYVS